MDPKIYEEIVNYKGQGTYPPGLNKDTKYVIRRRSSNFQLDDGTLYHVSFKNNVELKRKVVVGEKEANQVFTDFHNSPYGAHCGTEKTKLAISARFYWPGMGVDIEKWVLQCAQCQFSRASIKQEPKYIPICVENPLELLGMDLVGKVTKTSQGNEYICVIIDYYTKWSEAYAIPNKSAAVVSRCIINFFYRFGAPKRILTDQGTEFVNQINEQLCAFLNVERSLCAPYHPQTNGLVEKLNGTIQRALCKLVNSRPEKWDEYLDAVMFGLRTKTQLTTRFSPFFLMFGREARYPCEVPETYEVNSTVESVLAEDNVSQAISLKDTMDHIVKENVKKKQDRRQKVSNQAPFSVGQKVLRKNIRSQQRKGGKLERSWLGPYTIVHIQDKSADLMDEQGVMHPKISTDHLKPFFDDTPHIPHRIQGPQCKRPHIDMTGETGPSPSILPVDLSMSQHNQHPLSSPFSPLIPAPIDLSIKRLCSPVSHTTAVATLVPDDPTDAVHCINSAWAGNDSYVLLAKVGPYKVFYKDLQIGPGKKLESEVINSYLSLVVRQHNLISTEKAYHMDTFAITEMWKGRIERIKLDPTKYEIILGIVNEGDHWFLVAAYPSKRKVVLLDSLGESNTKKITCLVRTRALMTQKGIPDSHWVCETLPHPLQRDATSCGVFALKFAEHILQNTQIYFPNTPQEIKRIRMEIALTILRQSDDLSDLCRFCGEADTFDDSVEVNWISCDGCGRWFHAGCVGDPSAFHVYICFSCEHNK